VIPAGYREVDLSEDDDGIENEAYWLDLMGAAFDPDARILASGSFEVDIADETRLEDGLSMSDVEVELRLKEAAAAGRDQHTIICGHCNTPRRFLTHKKAQGEAIDWFHSHPCGTQEVEQAELMAA
jgi:hypothetical protein